MPARCERGGVIRSGTAASATRPASPASVPRSIRPERAARSATPNWRSEMRGDGVRVRAHLEARAAAVGALDGQQRDARAGVVVGAPHPVVEDVGRDRGVERAPDRRGRSAAPTSASVSSRWSRRLDSSDGATAEVDDRDRRDDDRAEREGEAEGEAAQRCYASVSRKR